MNYYNEIDPYAAQWLRNLIAGGAISNGFVDERNLLDVCPNELMGYTQCHFFAGIGVWSYALRLAGWPDDKPVWTGSCPCQPFSAAGQGKGFADERHLWPAWFHLISQCRPTNIFGEQVASKSADAWLDLVHTDMESLGYAFGAIPFPSAGIGAPHVRDRIYWMGNAHVAGLEGYPRHESQTRREGTNRPAAPSGLHGRVADTDSNQIFAGRPGRIDCTSEAGSRIDRERKRFRTDTLAGDDGVSAGAAPTNGFWRDADWLGCRDGMWRPVEPGTFPLANGIAARMGRLRAYGNAINAQAAAEFIRAANEERI